MKYRGVQNWVESNQQNIPYDLDFYTPFKEMAMLPGIQQKDRSRNRVKPRSPPTSSDSSLAQVTSPSSVSSLQLRTTQPSLSSRHDQISMSSRLNGDYARRKRHKTKADRYEYKGNKGRLRTKKQRNAIEKRYSRRRSSQSRIHHASNFHAPNVSRDRLTIKEAENFLRDGRASAPVKRPALPDLSFPDLTFMNLSQKWAAENARKRSLDRQLDKDQARRKRKQAKEERRMSRYFQRISSKAFGNPNHKAGKRNRDFVYETPCRQVNQPKEDSPEAIVDIDLLEKPFLGFGKPGPETQYIPTPKNAELGSSENLAGQHDTVFNPYRQNTFGARGGMNATSSDALSVPCSVDDRFQHSVTSNFRFARKQYKYQALFKKPCTSGLQKQSTDAKQDKILSLLESLQETQKRQLQQNENSASQNSITATAQTQTDLERPVLHQVEKGSSLAQELEESIQDNSATLPNDESGHIEKTGQGHRETKMSYCSEVRQKDGHAAINSFQPTSEHVKELECQNREPDTNDTAYNRPFCSPVESLVGGFESRQNEQASYHQAHIVPKFTGKSSRATSDHDVKNIQDVRDTFFNFEPTSLPTPRSLRFRPNIRSGTYPFYLNQHGEYTHDIASSQAYHASCTEPLSGETWIRTTVRSRAMTPRRIGRSRDSLDVGMAHRAHRAIRDHRDQLDGQLESFNNSSEYGHSQMASMIFDDCATSGSNSEEFGPGSMLELSEINMLPLADDEKTLHQFWKPNLLYQISEQRGCA